jgi:hypothetical protein
VVLLLVVILALLLEGVLSHGGQVLLVLFELVGLFVVADEADIGRDDGTFFDNDNITDDEFTG